VTLVRLQGVEEALMAEMLSAAFGEVYLPGEKGRGPSKERPVLSGRG